MLLLSSGRSLLRAVPLLNPTPRDLTHPLTAFGVQSLPSLKASTIFSYNTITWPGGQKYKFDINWQFILHLKWVFLLLPEGSWISQGLNAPFGNFSFSFRCV